MCIQLDKVKPRLTESVSHDPEPSLPKLAKTLSRPFNRLLSQKKPIPTLFCELVNRLGNWFSISNATFALYHQPTDSLKLTSWWDHFCFKEGILITLPKKNSIFYNAINARTAVHVQVGSGFPGNNIEKRIIISRETNAVAVLPLIYNDTIHGVIALASPVPYAFEMIEEGYLEAVFEKMAVTIAKRSPNEFWVPHFKDRNKNDFDRQPSVEQILKKPTIRSLKYKISRSSRHGTLKNIATMVK